VALASIAIHVGALGGEQQMIRRALWALIHPFRAAAVIRPDEPLPYHRLMPTLMLGGLFFILLHTRFVLGHWVWDLPYWPVILAQFMLLGVWVWLIGVLVLVVTYSWFGRRPALREIEIGVVYLWKALAAGTVHAGLVLGVRGGGDYTGPDHLRVVAVAVTGGLLSQGQGAGLGNEGDAALTARR
jgi:hypothetical protein